METWSTTDWQYAMQSMPNAALYIYTPLCGTCAVAKKMIEVIVALEPNFPIGKVDLNYELELAEQYEIESVPCLLIQKNGIVTEKVYAFRSVPHLLEKLR